jgi:hypothetical protein
MATVPDVKAELYVDPRAVQAIESGTQMAHQMWNNVSELKALKTEIGELLPDKSSWTHPENARKAVDAQLDWSERTLVRNTLDYHDAKIAMCLAVLGDKGNLPVTVQSKGGSKQITVRKLLEETFTDLRKSVLRHDNTYFRQMRYFFEIQVSGGKIPPFKTTDHQEEVPVPAVG